MVSNLALLFGNLFGYFSKNWAIFSKPFGLLDGARPPS
jgi:hypothetical protein